LVIERHVVLGEAGEFRGWREKRSVLAEAGLCEEADVLSRSRVSALTLEVRKVGAVGGELVNVQIEERLKGRNAAKRKVVLRWNSVVKLYG